MAIIKKKMNGQEIEVDSITGEPVFFAATPDVAPKTARDFGGPSRAEIKAAKELEPRKVIPSKAALAVGENPSDVTNTATSKA